MAINISVQVARSIARSNEDGLTLAVLKYARREASITDTILTVNTLEDLTTKLEPDSTNEKESEHELYVLEYLVRAGVNLLVYTTETVGSIDSDDIDNISDLETLNYKMLTAPYAFITSTNTEADLLDFAKGNDVQLLMDLDPDVATTDVDAVVQALGTTVSPKLELFVNTGLPAYTSVYTTHVSSDFDAANDFFGVPASAAAIAKRARTLQSGTPWIPVAGEVYGLVDEFTDLYRHLSTSEKTAFQAENLNVLFMKVGVGNLFVSQNTMVDSSNSLDPLRRAHVVTESLYIKRLLRREAERLLFAPNTIKTWNQFSLKAKSLFNRMVDQDGLEDFSIQVGRGITMTEQDIAEGKFKAVVTFLPVRVIESITFNIVIQESEDAYVVNFEGGDL